MSISRQPLNRSVPWFVNLSMLGLLARDEARGLAAVEALEKEGLSPKFHQLDILSDDSIKTISKFFVDKYGGLDILVNNAGIAFKVGYHWIIVRGIIMLRDY